MENLKNEGKTLSLIIKDYLDGIEKIMKKYSKPLKSIFTDYAFNSKNSFKSKKIAEISHCGMK